jgi:hypothetical protein
MKQLFTVALLIACLTCLAQIAPMQPNVPNGGRAVAVTRHPYDNNRLIIASETGGLFRSTNGGVNWTHVSGTGNFWFNDVLYYRFSNTVLAVASQDTKTTNGGGIWRSIDDGVSWSRVSVTPPVASCLSMLTGYALFLDEGTNKVWAGTSCGLAYTTDGGQSWNFVPVSANYNNDRVYAVMSAGNSLKILTDAGVKISNDGGASWTISTTGLPSYIEKAAHNQIAMSPLNHQHLFWAFNYWGFADEQWHNALYMSADNGNSWTSLVENVGRVRIPFVKTAIDVNPIFYVYHSDGGGTFRRAPFQDGASPTIFRDWSAMTADHDDGADMVFRSDTRTPLLYLTDGGVHTTTNSGSTWTMNGGGIKGYNALQITEIVGQRHSANLQSDLYFATQDNNFWASPDEGATWPNSFCCEGFFLNIPRQPLPAANTKFTAVNCTPCGNIISGPLFAGRSGFPNPTNTNGNPRLLDPGNYVHSTKTMGSSANIYNYTNDNGGSWAPKYTLTEEVRDFPKVSGTGTATTIFTAVRMPGSTSNGNEIIGIKRITGVMNTGTPLVSDITGFGSLGTFPTMFAFYRPFGVDLYDANHLIVPDIVDNVVKVTTDGGLNWQPDHPLTNLVTQGGVFKFSWNGLTQITNIAFDPEQWGHILVGTVQAGIFRSCNNGLNWEKITGSEQVPNVSSFYFTGDKKAIASSYGRGLWKLNISPCRTTVVRPVNPHQSAWPGIYYQGVWIPLKDLGNPDVCPRCVLHIVDRGEIISYSTARGSNKVEKVMISGGTVKSMDLKGNTVKSTITTQTNAQTTSTFTKDANLNRLFKANYKVKGIYLEDNIFKGLVLAKGDLTSKDFAPQQNRPVIRGELIYAGKDVKGIRLFGLGFNPQIPIQLMLNGQPLQLKNKEKYDEKGAFTFEIIYPFSIGSHTLLIIQKNERGELREAYTFNVAVQDGRKQ